MRYKLLGKSGLRVSELCLGTMTFGNRWGWGAPKDVCQTMFDQFAQAGGNFIDTSINYTDGEAEEILGDLLKADRDHFVLSSKYTLTKPDATDPNSGGNSRKNMMQSVERSLKRLQTDHLDLYYLHAWDYMTPVEEVMRGLDDLVRAGKVQYVGISDSPSYIAAEGNAIADLRGWSRFVALQVPYSLAARAPERSLMPMAKHWDMAVLTWGVLRSGVLTGKFLKEDSDSKRVNPKRLKLTDQEMAIVQEVVAIGEEIGRPASQVAINWVRQQQHKAQVIPLIGARTEEQMQDNLAVVDWQLSGDHLDRLEKVSQIDLGFPHGFLEANPYVFGATFDKIDNHRA